MGRACCWGHVLHHCGEDGDSELQFWVSGSRSQGWGMLPCQCLGCERTRWLLLGLLKRSPAQEGCGLGLPSPFLENKVAQPWRGQFSSATAVLVTVHPWVAGGVSEATRLQPAWLLRSKCRVCLCSCQASAVGVQTRCSSTKLWCTQLSSTGSFFFVPVTSSTGNAELLPRIHLQEIPLPLLSRASLNTELWPLGMRHCFSLDSSLSWVMGGHTVL